MTAQYLCCGWGLSCRLLVFSHWAEILRGALETSAIKMCVQGCRQVQAVPSNSLYWNTEKPYISCGKKQSISSLFFFSGNNSQHKIIVFAFLVFLRDRPKPNWQRCSFLLLPKRCVMKSFSTSKRMILLSAWLHLDTSMLNHASFFFSKLSSLTLRCFHFLDQEIKKRESAGVCEGKQ